MARPAFNLARLHKDLRPFRLYWFPRLRSTNDHAAALRKRRELFAPVVVLAGSQTAGRGRGTNAWWSGPGSITVTFVLPIDEHLAPTQVPLAAGLAVRNTLAQITAHEQIRLKWPNDVVCQHRKLAGVLCERLDRIDLIGIGLNLNVDPARTPASIRPRIASASAIAARPLDPNAALTLLAAELLRVFSVRRGYPFPALLKEYEKYDDLAGCEVSIQANPAGPALVGKCEGLDHAGRLLVRSGDELHRITTGHVRERL